LPIDTRLTAIPAAGPQPLAAFLAGPGDGGPAADLVVLPAQQLASAGIDSYLGVPAAELAAHGEVAPAAGEFSAAVPGRPAGPGPFLLLGLGDGSPAAMRAAGAAIGRRAAAGRSVLTSALVGQPAAAVHAFTVGLLLGGYRFSMTPAGPAGEVKLLVDAPDGQDELAAARSVAAAVALARDLTNMPSARKNPAWLASEAVAVAAHSGLAARVWEPAELAGQGFGGLLAVGSGSASPPRLIELRYTPPGAGRHVVLIGKGITFDSGGLSLKPADGMKQMKTDMAGGAAVIAVMSVLARLGVRVAVTGLVAAAENMPSGSALRPGDVITHFGGRTVEVLNTDAEGRLVLADALAYADTVLRPDVMVDIATLTGAARVALGTQIAALYASDEQLAAELLAASRASGDGLWRMPLVDDYRAGLDSPVADLANVPTQPGPRAGSVDAALFLREFTGGRLWAHLDIAGAARSSPGEGTNAKGATGFGTQLLLAWLTGAG
jgi:leucyl aminopeptidase